LLTENADIQKSETKHTF